MIDQGLVGDVDLPAGEKGGDGDDDGKLFQIALEVVRHGEDGVIFVAHQNDLGGLIEQLGVRLGDVEAAEGVGGGGREQEAADDGGGNGEAFHGDTSRKGDDRLPAPGVALAGQQEIDQRHERRTEGEGEEHPVGAVERERDRSRDEGDQAGEENAAGPGVGGGAGVRDHEKGEEEKGAVGELMEGDRDRRPEPEGAAEEEREIETEKGVGDVRALGAVDDEPAEAGEEKGEERGVPPLAGGDPDLAGRDDHRHEPEVRGVEDVLAAKPENELAADRHRGGEAREGQRVAPQEEAEREPGDERALGIERREMKEPGAGVLRQEGRAQEGAGRQGPHFEVQAEDAVDQERGQHGDLIDPWIEATFTPWQLFASHGAVSSLPS